MSTPTLDLAIRKTLAGPTSGFELDLQIRSRARTLVLIGPSGAGKTVTLKIVSGLLSPDAGTVAVRGRTLFDSIAGIDVVPQQRRVGYLFQDYALFPHLTVAQNVGFPLRRGIGNRLDRTTRERVLDTLHRFEIHHLADHHPAQLSGGQRQRAALARALLASPTVLLLDEPFAAMDRKLRARMRAELRDLHLQFDLPLIVVSHDPDDLAMFGEEVVEIESGRRIAIDEG